MKWLIIGMLSLTYSYKAVASPQLHDMMGYWVLDGSPDIIEFKACKEDATQLCGHLVQFEDTRNKSDSIWPDWLTGEEPEICGIKIVDKLSVTDNYGEFKGYIFDPEEGESYHLLIKSAKTDSLESRIYYGADTDEAVNMGINGALDGGISLFGMVSFATRAVVGEEMLGEDFMWRRVPAPETTCEAK